MSDISFYRRSKKGINIDISNRCPLECMRCQRQTNFTLEGRKVYGRDATMDEIRKLSDYFSSFNFCGQLSDPVHHPKFIEILDYLYKKDIQVTVHNASSQKPMKWYIKAFQAHPRAKWIFAIDGLPEESNMYRIKKYQKWNEMPYKERSLYKIFSDIKRICSENDIPQIISYFLSNQNLNSAKNKLMNPFKYIYTNVKSFQNRCIATAEDANIIIY